MIHALILDFDGVILDTETSLMEAYADVHRAHGVPLNREQLLKETGLADFTFDPWAAFPAGANRANLDRERHSASEARFRALPAMPGVETLVAQARTRSLKLGIASNSLRPHVEDHLSRLGLLSYFDCIAARGEGHPPKPEPHLYRHALATMKVSAQFSVAFEDSHAGVQAARSAGLLVVAVPNAMTINHDFSSAHCRFSSLVEVDFPCLEITNRARTA